MSDDITTGEVVRRLDRMEKATADNFERIYQKLDTLDFVRHDVYEAHRAADDMRFKALEQSNTDRRSRFRSIVDGVAFPVLVALIISVGAFLVTGNAHIGG